jgi:hypothetical protein
MHASRRELLTALSASGALVVSSAGAATVPGEVPKRSEPQAGPFHKPRGIEIHEPHGGLIQKPAAGSDDPLVGLAKRSDVRSRPVGVDLALYDPATANVHILNSVAGLLWQHVSPERSLASIHEMVWLAYQGANVTPGQVMRDLRGTVADLRKLGLIVPQGEANQGRSGDREITTAITERSLSKASCGYEPPAVNTTGLADLDRLARVSATFCDTWIIPAPNAMAR